MSGRDVLERNLARLLQKAYREVVPRPSFREGLRADFLARAALLGSGPGAARGSGPPALARRRPWRAVLGLTAAAAAVLLALWPWWPGWNRPAPGAGLETLLARGELALRAGPARGWTGSRAEALEFEGGFLELATPAGRGASVRAGTDRLELEAATRAVLRGPAAARALAAVELEGGGLTVERGASAGLEVATREGQVLVLGGRTRLAFEGPAAGAALRVRVERGRARVAAAAAPQELWLEAGQQVLLRGGRLLDEGPGALAAVPGAGRQQADRTAGESAPEDDPAAPGPAAGDAPVQVTGTVHLVSPASAGGDGTERRTPAEGFLLVFLRQVALPRVVEPECFEFAAAGGRFELGGLEPGSYEICARAPGHAPWRSEAVTLGPGSAPRQLQIELWPGARIEGLVLDGRTGLPVGGALVVSETDAPVQVLSVDGAELESQPGLLPSARSGVDGGFVLADLSPGEHVLRASAAGYGASWEGPRSPREGPFELVLSPGGRIEGQVLDPAGAPVEGSFLIVSLTDFGASHPVMSYVQAETDAGGRYVLDDLPAGTWSLLSFGTLGEQERLEPALAFVRVEAGQVTRHDFAAQAAGVRLEGVLTLADGTPAPDRAVWLTPARFAGRSMVSTNTDAEGRYRFQGLAAVRYSLFTSLGAPPDMIVLGDVDLSSGADVLDHRLRLAGAGLEGRVLDGAQRAPLEFAVVVLLRVDGAQGGFAGKTTTDATGHFRFDHVAAGSYAIQVFPTREPLGVEHVDGLELTEGHRLDLGEVLLFAGGALELLVTGPDGRPAAGVEATFRHEDGRTYDLVEESRTDQDGRLFVPGLKPGSWRIGLAGAGFAPRESAVDVRPAQAPQVLALELARP